MATTNKFRFVTVFLIAWFVFTRRHRMEFGGRTGDGIVSDNDEYKVVVVVAATSSSSSRTSSSSNTRKEEEEEEEMVKYYSGMLSNPPGICFRTFSDLPDKWKPPNDLIYSDEKRNDPWSADERALAREAAHKGLEELVTFYNRISPQRIIKALGGDAANSLIDECYASSHDPPFHNKACRAAAKVVNILAQEMIEQNNNNNNNSNKHAFCNSCQETKAKAKLLAYANYLSQALLQLPDDDDNNNKDSANNDKKLAEMMLDTRNALIPCVQATIDACGTLQNYLGGRNWTQDLQIQPQQQQQQQTTTPRKAIRDYVHHVNRLIDLYLIPELSLYPDLDQFISVLWKDYLPKYSFLNIPFDHYQQENMRHAFLVTHAAYMPTGYDRHMQYVQDAPWLYLYIRNNFYAALQQGSLDLFSEFVDIIRQYGCTHENDYMLRLGTRYLLNMYVQNHHQWMENPNGDDWYNDYDRIHRPWTTIAGVTTKQFEPIVPGSYGYAFRKALERAAANQNNGQL